MDDLQFYILFNSQLYKDESRWEDDYERLCAMEPCLWIGNCFIEKIYRATICFHGKLTEIVNIHVHKL